MASLTFLVLILGFGLPLLVLEWAAGWRELLFEWRPIVATVVMATAYLGLADVAAIYNEIYSVNNDRTVGLVAGGFVFEDWLLIAVINAIVAQFVVLALDEDVRARLRGLFR